MLRRDCLLTLGLLATPAGLLAHTPYRQWVVYRQKHLLIGCHRGHPETYDYAKKAVSRLEQHLPEASARVARARTPERLASLLGTGQLLVTIVSRETALGMIDASDTFAPYGVIPLQVIAPLADELYLVAHSDFPEHHGWLVYEALSHSDLLADDIEQIDLDTDLTWHPGSLANRNGQPLKRPPKQEDSSAVDKSAVDKNE